MKRTELSEKYWSIRKRTRQVLRKATFRLSDMASKPLQPKEQISVQPTRVKYLASGLLVTPEKTAAGKGSAAQPGDWDLQRTPLESLLADHALRERFIDGASWEETGYDWQALDDSVEGRQIKQVYPTLEGWQKRLGEIDWLYADLRRHAGSAPASSALAEGIAPVDESAVCIGREGEILAEPNPYRLILGQILGLQSLQTRVSVRHTEWMRLRSELLFYTRDAGGGRLFQPLTHPDLSDIPCIPAEPRYNLIERNLPISQGRILDIGANIGYFCHRLEGKGFDCTAVENNSQNFYFLERLKTAEARRFEIFDGSIFDFQLRGEYDVVLALNIFHHFLRKKKTCEQLQKLLKELRMRYMFLETHHPDEPHMQGTFMNLSPDEFVKFVLASSCLTQAVFLAVVEGGRRLYLLSR